MNESPQENWQDVRRKFWGTILSLMEDLFPFNEEILFAKTKYLEYGGSGFIMSCLRSYIDQDTGYYYLREACNRIFTEYQQQLLENPHNHIILHDIGKILHLDVDSIFLTYARSLPVLPTDLLSYHYLVEGIINKGTPEEIDAVIHAYTQHPTWNGMQLYGARYPIEPNNRFFASKLYKRMCAKSQRDKGRDNTDSWLTITNAAHCIATMKDHAYDAVIGILGSGAHIPNMVQVYGTQNTGLIEFHRSRPEWYEPEWVVRPDVSPNGKILLCENDACTGTTLCEVYLKVNTELEPQSVDVCFTGFGFPHSKQMAKSMHMFGRVFHARELPQDRVYSNFLEVRRKMKECCKKK